MVQTTQNFAQPGTRNISGGGNIPQAAVFPKNRGYQKGKVNITHT